MSSVYFNGPYGRIEGRYHQNEDKTAPIALVLPPNPAEGGTMNNKVAYTVFKSFVNTGFSVLRINFPGVGFSEGVVSDDGDAAFRVASTAMDWIELNNPESSHCWIGGFSFGSGVALQIATRRPEIEKMILVAPFLIGKQDLSVNFPSPTPCQIISGSNDSISSASEIANGINILSKKKSHQIEHRIIKDADHFFKDKLNNVQFMIEEYINISIAMRIAKPVRKKRRKRKKRDREYDKLN